MRENRPHGSEGGGAGTTGPSYPYEVLLRAPRGPAFISLNMNACAIRGFPAQRAITPPDV